MPRLQPRPRTVAQGLRYVGVGAVATAVHFLVLSLVVEWNLAPAWVGSGLGAIVGAQVAYAGNLRFTFAGVDGGGVPWLRFQLTALAGALLGMLLVAVLTARGLNYLVAQGIATAVVTLATFAVNRSWTFRARAGPG